MLDKVYKTSSSNQLTASDYDFDGSYNLTQEQSGLMNASKQWVNQSANLISTFNMVTNANRLNSASVNKDGTPISYGVSYNPLDLRPSGITENGQNKALNFDDFGNLTSSSGENYTLDYQGRRVKVVDASGNTTYQIYSPANELIALADSAGTITTMFINGPGNQVLGKVTNVGTANENVEFFINDYRGDIVMETADNGETLAANQYDVWGTPTNLYKKAGEVTDFAFTGKFWNPTTKDYNLGARTYSPIFKRFLTDDNVNPELSNLKSYNPYLYANGDPVNFMDPNGNSSEKIYQGYAFNGINSYMTGITKLNHENWASRNDVQLSPVYQNWNGLVFKPFLDIGEVFLSRFNISTGPTGNGLNKLSPGLYQKGVAYSGGCDTLMNNMLYHNVLFNEVKLFSPQLMFYDPKFVSAKYPNTHFQVYFSDPQTDFASSIRLQLRNPIDDSFAYTFVGTFGSSYNFDYNYIPNINHSDWPNLNY